MIRTGAGTGKIILNVAPTGMVPTKTMNERVPVSVSEIVADAIACAELGASIVHLHARDEDGTPTYEKEIYARIIGGIRNVRPDLIICVSLSGRNFPAFAQRADPLLLAGDLKPDMGSLTLSSMNFARVESMNSPDMVRRLADAMAERDIKPEIEVFDAGMVHYSSYLAEKGIIAPPFYFNFLLGNISSAQCRPDHLALMLHELPPQSYWCAAGLGSEQLNANLLGMMFGSGARVGLEDNLWFDTGRQQLATNSELVRRVVQLGALLDLEFASPQEVRQALGLRNAP